jgi:hypothetical protein
MSSPFVSALFHPLNLMILLVAVGAGLIAAWWLFPLGLVLWMVMVTILTRDVGFRLAHTMQNRAPLATRFQKHFDRVKRAQIGLFNAANSLPAGLRPGVQPVLSTLSNLVDEVYNLCQRMTALENYRTVSTANANLQEELDILTEKVNRASDPAIKNDYEDALAAMRQRLNKLYEASKQLDRVDAELTGLVSDLNTQVTDILRLQMLPKDQVLAHISGIVKALEDHQQQIRKI